MRYLTLAFVVLALLAGCRSNPFRDDIPPGLEGQVQTFEDVVRWRELDKMYVFLKPDPDQPTVVQPGLSNIRVTGYEATPLRQAGDFRWTTTAVIDYVLTDRQVVRQVIDQQVWESEDEGETWFRTSPVPQFR